MRICKEINLHTCSDFSEFTEEAGIHGEITLDSDEYEDPLDLPCYLRQISGTQNIKEALIPAVLEAACYFSEPDAIVTFSVTDREPNHEAWLDAVRDCPGVQIIEHKRFLSSPENPTHKVFFVMVPATPIL